MNLVKSVSNIRHNKHKFSKCNESQSMDDVISWFKRIKNKQNCKFISFDTKDF